MKAELHARDNGQCDQCWRKTDTLYFAGTSNICDECRERELRLSVNGRNECRVAEFAEAIR